MTYGAHLLRHTLNPEGDDESDGEPELEPAPEQPGNQLDLTGLGFDPNDLAKQLFDNVNFGGPPPGGDLPPELVAVFYRAVQMYSGPIPPPEIMERYKLIDPTFPERIFAMAERQSEHRISLESTRLRGDGVNERLGLILSVVIVLSVLACGTVIILLGKSWFGLGLILVGAIGLVGVLRADLKRLKLSLGKKAKISIRASGKTGTQLDSQGQ
jgi:uncharacterized membrane protein